MLVFGSFGVRAAEAFDVLNNASTEFYVLAYVAMFAIGFFGPHNLRRQLPGWAMAWCGLGAVTCLLIFVLNAYPFVAVASPLGFAAKILGTIAGANVLGYLFYRFKKNARTIT
jgi:hypothetical protein